MSRRTALVCAGAASLAWVLGIAAPSAQSAPPSALKGGTAAAMPAPPSFPSWAYPWDPTYKAPPADTLPRHVPGSARTFSTADARDAYLSPDWHSADHPRMPPIVLRGRKPEVRACGMCHRAQGTGGPENSSLAGQPAAYIIQQMADFKSGARRFSGPRRGPVVLMIQVARAAKDDEVRAAAAYFSSLVPRRNIRVVETDTIPPTYLAGNFYTLRGEGEPEPLGRRIIEVPVDREQFELRDSWSQFRAYVPPGSVARGEALVTTPRPGTAITCTHCHGPRLTGTSQVPGIAGRSPSYIMRQLYDLKHGTRRGPGSARMLATVEPLSDDDMLSIAAYLATLPPA